jgi:hypothetical protein
MPVTRPAGTSLLLALVPFATMCFSVWWWDRVDPRVLGLPFNLFWLVACILLSSACLWWAQRIESARDRGQQ